jgi:hypothetical protein
MGFNKYNKIKMILCNLAGATGSDGLETPIIMEIRMRLGYQSGAANSAKVYQRGKRIFL